MKEKTFQAIVISFFIVLLVIVFLGLCNLYAIRKHQEQECVEQTFSTGDASISRIIETNDNTVECAECGCLIYKDRAITEKEISTRTTFELVDWVIIATGEEDYINYTYYCKKCAKNRGTQ